MDKVIDTDFRNFSQQVKHEIIFRETRRSCCHAAACYGIASFAKQFDAQGLLFVTEQKYIASHAQSIFSCCGINGVVQEKGKLFEFAIHEKYAVEKMLALFGHSGEEHSLRILQDNFLCDSCAAYFAASAFLCCGTITAPNKSYGLEFVTPRYNVLKDFENMLQKLGFAPKIFSRKGVNVLYFKASEQIEDMLTFMGAPKASMSIMNLKIYKDVRNTANRITNCETANIDKTVTAAYKLVQDIAFLKEKGILQSLPENLQEAAVLRSENPDVSLAELAQLSQTSLTKSGLSHRLRKLSDLAKDKRQQT